MPHYDYQCYDCGVLSEKRRNIAQADDPFKCPECGSENTKRAIAAPAVQGSLDPQNLKGSGKADFDRIVGRDAERRWEHINGEAAKKDAVRKETGQQAIGRKSDGSYAPVPQERLKYRDAAYKEFDHARKTGTKIEH